MDLDVVCSKATVLLLFIVAPIVCGGSVFSHLFVLSTYMSFYFCIHRDGEERAGCFTLIVFVMFCDS